MSRLWFLVHHVLFGHAVFIGRVSSFSTPPTRSLLRTPIKYDGASVSRLYSSRQNRVGQLLDWAKEADIQVSKLLDLKASKGSGLGFFAPSTPLETGSLLITVPSSIALTVECPGNGPDDRDVAATTTANLKELPWYVQMGVYLYKLDQVDSSKNMLDYRPWLNSLPRTFDTPLHWSSLDDLQYASMSESVQLQQTKWKSYYDQLQISDLSYDTFVWACECARSRAFSGSYTGSGFDPKLYAFTLLLVTVYVGLNLGTLEQAANGAGLVVVFSILKDFVFPKFKKTKRYVICPMIDMANHRSKDASADVSFEFFGNAYSLAVESTVPRNQQLFISYGERSNDQLLQYYGFVEPDNPSDVYIMPALRNWDIVGLETTSGRTFQPGRLDKLDRAGLLGTTSNRPSDDESGNPMGGVVVSRKGGIDPAVLQALRALVSTPEEWDLAGQAIGNFSQKLNEENERAAMTVAKTALTAELDAKPTTLEQDEEQLKNLSKMKSSNMEDKLAIQFRIEKKKLLRDAIEELTS